MTQRMKILGLRIKNYRQFKSFYLDLTNPDDGNALDKACLIGANGTGKSTVLNLISYFLEFGEPSWLDREPLPGAAIAIHLEVNTQIFWLLNARSHSGSFTTESLGQSMNCKVLSGSLKDSMTWQDFWDADLSEETSDRLWHKIYLTANTTQRHQLKIPLKANSNDLAIYAAPDGHSILSEDVPHTTLNDALALFNNMPAFHLSSYNHLEYFWNVLIYQIKKREKDFQTFLSTPEIQNLTVANARGQFNATHPEILTELAKQWNLILERAGLELDIEGAAIPVQITENLQAYIRSKKTHEPIPYNQLSTGIRNFIFRLGHIYTLYFNRQIDRGFLLIDEPEASLFPDLLYDLIERYLSIVENTQFFVATQSPIIAAQFKPEERMILEFNNDHYVTCRRGISPEGDDPNDLLVNDFVVRSLYGKEGLKQWNRYLELRRTIPSIKDTQEKRERLAEYARIGNTYNFAEHEISGET